MTIAAPFPWFGGKSRVAPLVWSRFGRIPNYVEPFAGSLAVLLGRPDPEGHETVNDLDCHLANVWRAIKAAPDAVAEHADWPVNEADLHPRHSYLVALKPTLAERVMGDPDYYDAKVAGWWLWGIACWIGSGWCSGSGPWQTIEVDGVRKLVHLSGGQGVQRKLVHLGKGRDGLIEWMTELADRLRHVRVCCGEWDRVLGRSPTELLWITGIMLDPPYADTADRDAAIYAEDSLSVAHAVREWAIANGDNPMLRIALCGYEREHQMPESWEAVAWTARGGYGAGRGARGDENKHRERIWFSPHCLKPKPEQPTLWDPVGVIDEVPDVEDET